LRKGDREFNQFDELDDFEEYEGYFLNSRYHGEGKYTSSNGDYFEGEWKKGKRKNGYGQLTLQTGDVFLGNLKNRKFSGEGKMTYINGDIYEGCWENGARHGNAKWTKKDQPTRETVWELGKLI
jgi:1-phosphatidylinositol-4-phosphate 5-kinase